MAKSKKEIIQILATKYNLPLEKVEEMVNSQFKYVSRVMANGSFDSVRLPYFGRFSSKIGRRNLLNEKKWKSS